MIKLRIFYLIAQASKPGNGVKKAGASAQMVSAKADNTHIAIPWLKPGVIINSYLDTCTEAEVMDIGYGMKASLYLDKHF
jgi:hypothetical protein